MKLFFSMQLVQNNPTDEIPNDNNQITNPSAYWRNNFQASMINRPKWLELRLPVAVLSICNTIWQIVLQQHLCQPIIIFP